MYVLAARESSSVDKQQLLTSKMNTLTTTKPLVTRRVQVGQLELTTTSSGTTRQQLQQPCFKKRSNNKQQLFCTSLRKPSRCIQLMVVILALGAIIFSSIIFDGVKCQEQLSIESRQQKDNDDLNDAIKYLEKLDKYFSQMARPRYGRSQFKQPFLRTFGSGGKQLMAPASGGSWSEPTRYNNLMDLASARLAQRYRDGLAY